jgi:hypothetical protein
MSEYQYYEFQAVDRPLKKTGQDQVRALSSRAEVNARSARFVYNYGDFRGDAEALMWAHYDAMLYLANWGMRRLLLRFPRLAVDADMLAEYAVEDMIDIRTRDEALLLQLLFQDVDQGAWLDGEGWSSSLVELRRDIRHGDLRLLYLAWLKACCEQGGANDEAVEPPIPAGLGQLSEAHRAFIELFDLNPDLVAAAAEASPPLPDRPESPSAGDFEKSLVGLLAKAKDRLTQAAQNGTLADVDIELGRELRATLGLTPARGPGQRAVAQLRELADTIAEHQAEAERLSALEALAKREPEAWQEVEQLCERKVARAYGEAVALLCQLNDVAQLRGESIAPRLTPLLQRWKNRPALLKRLKAQGLM